MRIQARRSAATLSAAQHRLGCERTPASLVALVSLLQMLPFGLVVEGGMLMWGDVHSCSGCAVRLIRSSRVAVVQAVRKRLGSCLVAVSEERLASGVARVAALLVGALAAHGARAGWPAEPSLCKAATCQGTAAVLTTAHVPCAAEPCFLAYGPCLSAGHGPCLP